MPRLDASDIRTPEEVLKSEIEDLERPMLRSRIVWVGSIVLAAFVGAVGTLLLIARGRDYPQGLVPVEIAEPHGEQEKTPTVYRAAGINSGRYGPLFLCAGRH